MNSAPKISLVIATYNRAHLLPESPLVTGRTGSFSHQIANRLRFPKSQDD
jgi:hypothetical protein